MGQSFFHFRQFSITHQDKGLKVGSDSCLLGSIASHGDPRTCLDIGTGTGVIALMLAQRYPKAQVTAVEIQEAVYGQAALNTGNSIFSSRVEVMQGDFLQMGFKVQYDLIVCNPPYFMDHLPGASAEKNIALHNSSLPFAELAHKVVSLLRDGGKFWLILPEAQMQQFRSTALQSGLYNEQLLSIQNRPGKLFRQVASFSASARTPLATELLMHDNEGERTNEYKSLMCDFYLENTEIYRRPR